MTLRPPTDQERFSQETKLRVTNRSDVDQNPGVAAGQQRPPTDVSSGQLLGGRYRLERELGEGGMGVVYFARDEEIKGEIFAIKVLKPEIRERPEALEMVREEVRKTRSIAGPNIVGMYSVNLDGANVFILMEYLEGKALNTLLDDDFGRGMPFNRAWPLIEDICTALAYAHDHSVIHSDLKPSNIFVTTAGRAKLLDFGIARAARGGAGRFDPAALGALTLAYASCEMLEGGKPDQRDDVYSLGCVIYEMLSGKHPFDCTSAREAQQAGLRVAPIASLTSSQNAALAQTLAFDRAKRTNTVEALLAGLALTTDPHRAALWKRPFAWIGLACFVLLGLAGIVWFAANGTKDRTSVAQSQAQGSSQQDSGELLSRVQTLMDKARSLDLDPADPLLRQGTQQLADAQRRMAAGAKSEGKTLLASAEKALQSAVRSAKRLGRLGTEPDEIAQAMRLCQDTGSPCSAGDFADEKSRTVSLKPFELDEAAVSNREFGEFAAANDYGTAAERAHGLYVAKGSKLVFQPSESWKTLRDSLDKEAPISDYPVRGIDFKSATDYCRWRGARLATEDEWEYMARGADHRIYAWGNEPRLQQQLPNRLLPIQAQPNSGRFGARGLGDGVLEWVNGGTATEPVLRGSSWLDSNPVYQRLAMRRLLPVHFHALVDSGFRCAKSTAEWPD